jgi:hypothetical protein
MKKNILFMTMLAMAGFTLSSCSDKETEGTSRITTYAVLELNGDAYETVQLGSSYNDPGCTAKMGDEDVTDKIVTDGAVNTNKLGYYDLSYRVINADGFAATASRTVAVVDKANFASPYFAESQYGSRHFYNAPIAIEDNGDGTYTIEDLAGGFYSYGRYPGYDAMGYDFFLDATLSLNADNTINLVECNGDNWFWGDPMTLTSGTYDPATGTVTLVLDFDGTPMYVTLTK